MLCKIVLCMPMVFSKMHGSLPLCRIIICIHKIFMRYLIANYLYRKICSPSHHLFTVVYFTVRGETKKGSSTEKDEGSEATKAAE